VTAEDLREAEARYQRAFADAEAEREKRKATILAAVADGWTHADIGKAMGISAGRISQIVPPGASRRGPGRPRSPAR
jgi:DNA-directed RNA polymerase specialized sigma24 family protein